MDKCILKSVLRDALFMVYVLTREGVSNHFDLSDLCEVYSLLIGRDLEDDFSNFKGFDNGN